MRNVPMHCGRRPTRRGQHQIGAIRLQQIGRTDVRLKSLGDQRDHVHQRLGGLAAFRREVGDLLQGQDMRDFAHMSVYFQLWKIVAILL